MVHNPLNRFRVGLGKTPSGCLGHWHKGQEHAEARKASHKIWLGLRMHFSIKAGAKMAAPSILLPTFLLWNEVFLFVCGKLSKMT